ncbi:hypothetical protein ANN_24687 [Periplaneta americana]|uniref:Zinc finger PHD-type domain-containing protein n=1 Tax=Periplaneta americana TaxID=6978 RepID=A0ABQ8S430_PERAM|nr:hypothetical protein ANN_24687 [Periplaneta americana]
MLSTPPHTTHKLQPLDRVFMKPFKDAYYEACGLWMRKNPAARITEYKIASLVGDAFARVSGLKLHPYKTYLEEKNNEKLKREVKSLVRGKCHLSGKFSSKSSKKTAKKNDEKEETTCIFCGESHEEDWIQCSSCQMWAHKACASIPETSDAYECDFCQK